MITLLENMTEEEQKAWWFSCVEYVLSQYIFLMEVKVDWLSYTHNAVFDISHMKEHFILRLKTVEFLETTLEEAETRFLRQLYRDTNLVAPCPVPNIDGQLCLFPLFDIGNDNKTMVAATLFEHIEGEVVTVDNFKLQHMLKVGEYLAQLHQYTMRYKKSYRGDGADKYALSRKSLDYEGLFGEKGIYYPGEEAMKIFTDEQISIMDTVAEKVKSAMDELGTGENEFGLIHGDLLLKNILFHEGDVRALDFEYCGWGYYLYDLTPILWQLKPQERYTALEQALWDGYTSIRPLSDRHRALLETFIAARQVASMRWVAANRHNPAYVGKVEGIMAQRTAELQDFLETGILNRA